MRTISIVANATATETRIASAQCMQRREIGSAAMAGLGIAVTKGFRQHGQWHAMIAVRPQTHTRQPTPACFARPAPGPTPPAVRRDPLPRFLRAHRNRPTGRQGGAALWPARLCQLPCAVEAQPALAVAYRV